MPFQIGHLQFPDKSDSVFEDYWEALAEAENKSIDDNIWAVWTSQQEGSELMAIIYESESYTR